MADAAKTDEIATGTEEVNSGHLRAFIERIERTRGGKRGRCLTISRMSTARRKPTDST